MHYLIDKDSPLVRKVSDHYEMSSLPFNDPAESVSVDLDAPLHVPRIEAKGVTANRSIQSFGVVRSRGHIASSRIDSADRLFSESGNIVAIDGIQAKSCFSGGKIIVREGRTLLSRNDCGEGDQSHKNFRRNIALFARKSGFRSFFRKRDQMRCSFRGNSRRTTGSLSEGRGWPFS